MSRVESFPFLLLLKFQELLRKQLTGFFVHSRLLIPTFFRNHSRRTRSGSSRNFGSGRVRVSPLSLPPSSSHAFRPSKPHLAFSSVYSVIGVVSGDGVIHELFNGFAGRKDALKCLRIPIVPIPAGSGNGLSISIHGKVDGWSCSLATLNLIKGESSLLNCVRSFGRVGSRI